MRSSSKQTQSITTQYLNDNNKRQTQCLTRRANKRRKAVSFSTQPDDMFHYRDSPLANEERNVNKKRRKAVCFSAKPDDISHFRDSPLTNEEMNSIWYSDNDIIRMKTEARNLASRLHNILRSRDTVCEHKDTLIRGCVDQCRGLEFHIFTERRLKNEVVKRTIMDYQRLFKARIAVATKNGDPNLQKLKEGVPEALCVISSKCTRWARDVARASAKLDFKEAYVLEKRKIIQAPLPQKALSRRLEKEERFPLKKRKFLNEATVSLMNRKKKMIFESKDHREQLFAPTQVLVY